MMLKARDVTVQESEEARGLFHARWRGKRIGSALTEIHNDRLVIHELIVLDKVLRPWPWPLYRVLRPRFISASGCGVGTMLLNHVTAYARAKNCSEIWGCVTGHDAVATTYLLDSYRRRGFSVLPPDEECPDGMAHKVILRL